MKYAGRCHCSAITWGSDADVLWAGHCHCESCIRVAPADYVSWMGLPRDRTYWKGDPIVRETAPGVERGHCGACGTALFYRNAVRPDEIHLYAVTLDDLSLYKPQAHYHWTEHLPWVRITDDLPRYPGSSDATEPI